MFREAFVEDNKLCKEMTRLYVIQLQLIQASHYPDSRLHAFVLNSGQYASRHIIKHVHLSSFKMQHCLSSVNRSSCLPNNPNDDVNCKGLFKTGKGQRGEPLSVGHAAQ